MLFFQEKSDYARHDAYRDKTVMPLSMAAARLTG
jgi:hypothetical protein